MADAPKITVAELRAIVTDAGELAKGAKIVDDKGLSNLSRHEHKLFADAAGSTTYKVQAIHEDKGWRARCSCMAARSRPFCKHGAALLVAWQRSPDAFAVSDAPPPGSGDAKKKAVKSGKVDVKALMAKGVEQVATLVRELAVTGAASLADDRGDQVRALGENLREHKLRRLSAKTIALADLVDTARSKGDDFDHLAYAELLGDLLLTARKLEKHIAGEALEDRHVEELIGKTWTKKDRGAIDGLDLVEVAFLQRETPDNFVIRESRFVDAKTGEHYSEKQILPGFLVKRTPPKLSYAGKLLRGAGGGLYPGFSPRRTDLESPGTAEALKAEALDALVEKAVPSVKAAIAALADHKKDVFAPETLPVVIACDMVIADRGRLQLAGADGSAVFLPDDDEAADRLASALAGVSLDAVIGDLTLDGALPTLSPLAVVVRGKGGKGPRELRSIATGMAKPQSRKVRVEARAGARKSNWAYTARALDLSTAAIALGEIREELADLVYTGLSSVTPRRVEAMATRLGELSLAKQADLLRATAARADASDRLDDIIRLHQVLGIALARLAGAAHVERDALAASPMFASVFVRKATELLAPAEIRIKLARGEVNRFEAAALTGRYYETLSPDSLVEQVFPAWADGSASPYIALAARARPEAAIASARRVVGGRYPRMASITALRVLEALGSDEAKRGLHAVETRHADSTLRSMARNAIGRLAGLSTDLDPKLLATRTALFNASTKDERARSAERLADAGDVGAIPYLRTSFSGDISGDVRDAAGRALGRLGDAESVDTFCVALAQRDVDHERAKTSAYALGSLGDVRGLAALVDAYRASWLTGTVAESLAAIGPAAIPLLLEVIELDPALLKRSTATTVFEDLRSEDLLPALVERIEALAKDGDFVPRATALVDLVKNRAHVVSEIGAKIMKLRPDLVEKSASREARALARKVGATPV
ncbi:MAG TPA: HEAT repeat domain-containing protein [Kofleriaceae bacterium]